MNYSLKTGSKTGSNINSITKSNYYKNKYIKWKTDYLNLSKFRNLNGGKKKKSKKTKGKLSRNKEVDLSKDQLLGCFYGLCVGDAIGTRYEFTKKEDAEKMINNDMVDDKLPLLGGGPFKTEPGQISDDSEMMLCLLLSLSQLGKYDQEDVADNYINWYKSKPIDIGMTITRALHTRKLSLNSTDMISNSAELNRGSLSNGTLMRIAPLGMYGLNVSKKELRLATDRESDLTHPNPILKDAAYIYCLAIKYALTNMKKKDIFEHVLEEASKKGMQPRVKIILKDSLVEPEPSYIVDVKGNEFYAPTDSKKYQGYFGIALQNAFFELMNGKSYEQSIVDILKRGGDTDTNAAIAGALLGAHYGINELDKDWLETVKNASYMRIKMYPMYSPNKIDEYVDKYLAKVEND